MEFPGFDVHHIQDAFGVVCGRGVREGAFPGGVVNHDSRLDVVAVDVEQHALALVLHGHRFHLHAAGYQIFALENRRDAVEDMVPRFFYVVRREVLKRQHPLDVQIARARDEVLFVGVFGGQLVAD